MELNTSINSNELNNSGYKINKKLTSFLVLGSAILIQFFLIYGSLTENRFGTHLVFNGDLISSPLWFMLSILVISISFIVLYLVYLGMSQWGVITYKESADKSFKIGSLFLIGFAIWFLALSSFSFAAWNYQFFESQINDGLKYNGISISLQSLIIGIFAIIVLGLILISTKFVAYFNKNFSNKSYKILRNFSFMLIAISFFQFNLSLIAFGTFGGDSGTLITGLLGIENPEGIYNKISGLQGRTVWLIIGEQVTELAKTIFGESTIAGLSHVHGVGTVSGDEALRLIMIELWDDGISTFTSNGVEVVKELSDPLRITVAELAVGTKEGLYGVNNSLSAVMLYWSMYIALIGLVIYLMVSIIKTNEDSSNWKSLIVNVSIFTIILLLILFGFMSWISPYLPGDYEYSTILPGLIAAPGEHGGISSAFVYFMPGYYGTLSWKIMMIVLVLIPVVTIGSGIFSKIFFGNKENIETSEIEDK